MLSQENINKLHMNGMRSLIDQIEQTSLLVRNSKMLNDSYWKEYNDGEMAYLWSANRETIAYIQKKDTVWDCIIYPELIAESFYYNGMSSIEEVEWQVTLYIGNKCNKIANQLHKIRDHLPDIHELARKAEVTRTFDNKTSL